MANDEHVAILKKGVAAWNEWRAENPDIHPNLTQADLTRANLSEANLSGADLTRADLSGAVLKGAKLWEANLSAANLSGAYLQRADLQSAILIGTDLTDADLTGCRIFGVSAWGLNLERTKQQNLVITQNDEPAITVDDIEVAQFVYLLLHNQKIRHVIDTIGKKGVLLLGRFTEGRIAVLERLREKLRDLGYVPMVFNFDKPETKDFSETVRLLANLSKFVIVDITNPRSAPLELQATVPDYMVPFVPILQQGGGDPLRDVRRLAEQVRLGAQTRSWLSLRRQADRGAGGQGCQTRRGKVQRTPGAADQPTSRRERLNHRVRTC